MQNYYELLGVPRDASQREIAKAYRRRAVVHHRSKVIQLKDHLDLMAEACATLSDPERRKLYDEERWGYPTALRNQDERDRREGRVRAAFARELGRISLRRSELAVAANADQMHALATEHDLREARDARARRRRDHLQRAAALLVLVGLAALLWLLVHRAG